MPVLQMVKKSNGDNADRVGSAARALRYAPGDISLADPAEAGLGSVEHGANLSDVASLPSAERAKAYTRIARSGMFVTPTLVSDGMWAPDSLVLAAIHDTAGASRAVM